MRPTSQEGWPNHCHESESASALNCWLSASGLASCTSPPAAATGRDCASASLRRVHISTHQPHHTLVPNPDTCPAVKLVPLCTQQLQWSSAPQYVSHAALSTTAHLNHISWDLLAVCHQAGAHSQQLQVQLQDLVCCRHIKPGHSVGI